MINSTKLIDRLEKGILNTDFADRTDSFFGGTEKDEKKNGFLQHEGFFYRVLPKSSLKCRKKVC